MCSMLSTATGLMVLLLPRQQKTAAAAVATRR
jgi:hypothetical protein